MRCQGEEASSPRGEIQIFGWQDPTIGIRLRAGDLDFSIVERPDSYKGMTLYNDAVISAAPDGIGDALFLEAWAETVSTGPPFYDFTSLRNIYISLVDHDETEISDVELPDRPPQLSELELADIWASTPFGDSTVQFHGVIDRLVALPEPTSALLLASGLAALASRRRAAQ